MPVPKTNVLPDGPRKKSSSGTKIIARDEAGRPVHRRTGLPIIDATTARYLTVAPEDAERADLNDPRTCGFAVCARRLVPGLRDVEFYLSVAFFIYDDHVLRYELPQSSRIALQVFDQTHRFEPGEYWMSAVAPARRLGIREPKARSTAQRNRRTVRQVTTTKIKGRPASSATPERPLTGETISPNVPRRAPNAPGRMLRSVPVS